MSGLSSKNWPFQLVAHRGFKAHYAENTLVSFEKAVEAKATMIELDVRMTKDDVVIILHDPTLLRLGSQRRHVSAMNWSELKKVNLHDKAARHLKSGSVLSFEELLSILGAKINYYIEIKATKRHGSAYKERLCRHVVELVEKYALFDQALFVTFDLPMLEYLAGHRGDLKLGLNFWGRRPDKGERRTLTEIGAVLCPHDILVDKHCLTKDRAEGFKVMPWVVNEAQRMEELIAWGVDGITTDHPDRLRSVFDKMQPNHLFLGPT